MLVTVLIAAAASVAGAALVHFLTRNHLVRAAETKSVHLVCSFCGLLVARFVQLNDSRIICANCKRAAEKNK